MNARIKLSAKTALTGAQLKIIPTLAVLILLTVFFSLCNPALNLLTISFNKYFLLIFPAISLLFSIAAIAPLRLRLEIKHLLLARGINPSQKLNLGLSGILKACEMCVCMFFIKLFWLAVFEAVPVSALAVFLLHNARKAVSLRAAFVFFSGMFILALAGFGFYLLFIQKYSKSMFYLACYKDFTVTEAISESIRKTKDKTADILFFKLGFTPWFLLCILIFPAFYVIPYYKQSVTCLFLSR
ncbi:MAG: hypothetical protein IJE74_05525 [Clostridia bacterium]|nr:hypothetical protein [Clostridia bacterium]